MWLSATEGDKNRELASLDHWPETELVNNEIEKLEAVETVWRDFYSGKRLESWRKPYYRSNGDAKFGDTFNCMAAFTDVSWDRAWYCLLYTSPSPRDATLSRMPSSA